MFLFNVFQFINGIPAACTSTQFNLEMTFLKAVSPYAYMTFFQKFPRRFYFKNITSIILLKINLPVTRIFSLFDASFFFCENICTIHKPSSVILVTSLHKKTIK